MGIAYYIIEREQEEWDEIYLQILEDYINYGITSIFIPLKKVN
jgi:hypothetical protein